MATGQSQKGSVAGVQGGYAPLDSSLLIPPAYLPSGYAQSAIATRTAGDLTTTSTTFVDVTDMTVTLTTGARRCLVFCSALGGHTGSGSTLIDIAVDGTRQGQTLGLTGGNSASFPLVLTFLTPVLSAGSHTIKLQWRVDAGTAQIYASTAISPAILTVLELIAGDGGGGSGVGDKIYLYTNYR